MDRDSRRMRGSLPFVFTNLHTGEGLARVIEWIEQTLPLHAPSSLRAESIMPPLLVNHAAMANIGRVGCLDLRYRHEGTRTIPATSRCSRPGISSPAYLDDSGCAVTSLVNPSGDGGDDALSIHAVLEEGKAHVVMTTPPPIACIVLWGRVETVCVPSVARVPSSSGFGNHHSVRRLAFRSDHGSHIGQGRDRACLGQSCSGRVARGERWAFTSCAMKLISLRRPGRDCWSGTMSGRNRNRPGSGIVVPCTTMLPVFVVSDAVDPARWPVVRETVAGILDSLGSDLLGGVTEPPIPGLAAKLVSRSPGGVGDGAGTPLGCNQTRSPRSNEAGASTLLGGG